MTFESEHERQPMTLDGQVWITGDVRIDGRAGLIEELRARGQGISGNAPDVELILHADPRVENRVRSTLDRRFRICDLGWARPALFCVCISLRIVPFYYAQVK